VESSVLTRIGEKRIGRIYSDKMVMAQIPHHGSKGNLNKSFWQMRKRNEHTPAVLSVGENSYRHPSKEVVSFFDKTPNYEIASTNMCGALSPERVKAKEILQILDVVSTDITAKIRKQPNKDKVFIFDGVSCTLKS